MNKNIISWIAQILIFVIIGQTLFFKFTDAPETVELFAKLGLGPVGYKLIGFLELIACLMLVIRPTIAFGAILSLGLMSGAVLAHVTRLGFQGPELSLGLMAILAWILSAVVILLRRDQLSFLTKVIRGKSS